MYTPKEFKIPELAGISGKQLEVHLGLYKGYVTHVNLIREKLQELKEDKNAYVAAELRRRFGFEFNGMRMHEYYFEQFESGSTPLTTGGALEKAVSEKYGSWDDFIGHVKTVSGTRGIGWVIVYFDPVGKVPHTVFVGDHELGQLAGLPILLALDLWEHAYMVDYTPSEKKQYVEAFFRNLNWQTIEKRFA